MVDIVEVGLAVDSTQVDKGKARLKKLGDQARKTEKATDKMSRAFKTGMVAAMAAATVAVFSAIKAHREFTKSISELSSITGAVGKDLEFFKNQSLQLGESTTFSASQVATAFKLIASAKPDLLESKEALALVTREVLTLAEASGLDLPQAANALGGALNQFSAGASEANRFINVLAAGSKFGASAINETSEAMKNVGAVASSMGLSFESTNAAIQALASVSIKGTEAGTGLRGVLLKLAKQSRDEFNPEIVGLEQAMKNLKDANLTTTEKMNLFGLESTTAATALIAQADSIGILTEKLTGTGVAMEQAAINTNNLDGDIKMMSSAWEGAALFIGDMFDPALRAVVQTMGGAAKIIKSIGIAIKDMGDALGWFMAATAAVLTLDFDALDKINETRDKNAQKLKDEYDLIWNINGALDAKKEKEEAILAAKGEELAKEDQAAAGEKEAERLAAAMQASKLLREQEATEKEEDRIDMLFRDAEYNEEKVARESEARELRLEAEREEKELMLAEKQDYWDRLYNMQTGSQQASLDFANMIRKGDIMGALSHASSMLSNLAKSSKKVFKLQKIAALANAAVNLPSAIISSFEKGGGYPWGLIPAGLMAAQGASQISAIKASTFGGGSGAPSVGSGGGGSSPSASVASGLADGATATPDGGETKQTLITFNVEPDALLTGQTFLDMMEEMEANGMLNGAIA